MTRSGGEAGTRWLHVLYSLRESRENYPKKKKKKTGKSLLSCVAGGEGRPRCCCRGEDGVGKGVGFLLRWRRGAVVEVTTGLVKA